MTYNALATIGLALLLSSLTSACGGDDTSNGSGSGSGSGDVRTCTQLCSLAPVDSKTGQCVTAFITQKGYDTSDPRCSDANTESGCSACYDAISVSDSDCAATHAQCF